MQVKQVFSIGVISLTLMFTLTSVAFAESQHSSQADGHGSMEISGPDSSSSSSGSNNQHEAMPGMDPNMPGMENAENQVEEHGATGDGHDESSIESEGVKWPVVGGFLGINLLVIAVAGILKLTQ